jgi:hypothetical protein
VARVSVPRRSRVSTLAYLLAAIPALFLPISYIVLVGWVIVDFTLALVTDNWAFELPEILKTIGWVAIYATFIQLPPYIAWAALSNHLTTRARILWTIILFIGNMFAIPWFLYCQYTRTAQTALISNARNGSMRRYIEG